VPVYVSNEDYRASGSASADEKSEYQRLYREALQAKLSTGTVHAYVLTSDGHPLDSLHVADASKVELLTAMLERAVEKLKPAEGKPVIAPRAQAAPPTCEDGGLVLHLTSRYLRKQGSELVPLGEQAGLGQSRNASWSAYAAENWIVFTRDECSRLFPAANLRAGSTWSLDRDLLARLLNHFYPATENNDVAKNRIGEQDARATVLSLEQGVVRVRLDGSLRMKHPFYHKDDENTVSATFVGYLDVDVKSQRVRTFRLATDRATYGTPTNPRDFGVVVGYTGSSRNAFKFDGPGGECR